MPRGSRSGKTNEGLGPTPYFLLEGRGVHCPSNPGLLRFCGERSSVQLLAMKKMRGRLRRWRPRLHRSRASESGGSTPNPRAMSQRLWLQPQRKPGLTKLDKTTSLLCEGCDGKQLGSSARIWFNRDVPVSGRHGDTVQTGMARSGMVPTRPDTV